MKYKRILFYLLFNSFLMPFIIFSDEVSFPYLYQRCDFGSDFVKSTFITHIYSSYHCFFFCFQHEISVSRLWGVFLLPLHNSFPPTFLPKDLLSLDISPAGPSLTPSSSPRSPPPPFLEPLPTYLDALRACGRWRVARRSDRGGPAATIVSARRPGVQA